MNRSLAVKFDRAKSQRISAGMSEGNKLAYRTTKSADREIIQSCALMPKNCNGEVAAKADPTMVLYNPAISRKPLPLAMRCMVECGSELIKAKR